MGRLAGIGGIILVAALAFFAFDRPYAEVRYCNASPYSAYQLPVAVAENRVQWLEDAPIELAPGACARLEHWSFLEDVEFYVHVSLGQDASEKYNFTNETRNTFIRAGEVGDGSIENDITYDQIQLTGNTATCFTTSATSFSDLSFQERLQVQTIQPDCSPSLYFAGLRPTFREPWSLKWTHVWEHPNLPLLPASNNVDEAIEVALERARLLSVSIDRQLFYDREWGGQAPFTPGGRMQDLNGPLNRGVWLTSLPPTTSVGEPQVFWNGDAIVAVNDRPVFGEADLIQLLIVHGLSREAGIQEPVKYTVVRGDQVLTVRAPYFFNERYRQNTENQEGVAFWYGVGDAITFGQTPWAICYGNNGIRWAGNKIGQGVELLRSWWNSERYNRNNEFGIEYIDAAECKWQSEQARGLARQKERDVYVNSQWFAILTPSGVRLLGKKGTKAALANAGIKGASNARLADTVLEAGESALWSLGTTPPGVPTAKIVKDTAIVAGAGGLGGFVTSGLLKKPKLASK